MLVLLPGFHGDSSVFMEAPSEEADDRTQHVVCAADVMALIRKNLQQFKKRVRMCIQLQNGQHGKKVNSSTFINGLYSEACNTDL